MACTHRWLKDLSVCSRSCRLLYTPAISFRSPRFPLPRWIGRRAGYEGEADADVEAAAAAADDDDDEDDDGAEDVRAKVVVDLVVVVVVEDVEDAGDEDQGVRHHLGLRRLKAAGGGTAA